MHVNLVIKADDPTAAAEKLRVLGYELEPPNRPNPNRWTSSIAGTISILPADGDDCGLALAVPSFERLHCIERWHRKFYGSEPSPSVWRARLLDS